MKKQAAILEADGRLEASRRDAEAQVVLAEASQKAIEMVTSAVGDKEIPVAYLLGEQYVKAMQDMSKSNNAKNCGVTCRYPEYHSWSNGTQSVNYSF